MFINISRKLYDVAVSICNITSNYNIVMYLLY